MNWYHASHFSGSRMGTRVRAMRSVTSSDCWDDKISKRIAKSLRSSGNSPLLAANKINAASCAMSLQMVAQRARAIRHNSTGGATLADTYAASYRKLRVFGSEKHIMAHRLWRWTEISSTKASSTPSASTLLLIRVSISLGSPSMTWCGKDMQGCEAKQVGLLTCTLKSELRLFIRWVSWNSLQSFTLGILNTWQWAPSLIFLRILVWVLSVANKTTRPSWFHLNHTFHPSLDK